MQQFTLRKGLTLPVQGAPEQKIYDGPNLSTLALVGLDYVGLKPSMLVQEGDLVAAGTPLFAHKETPDAAVVSPISGRVKAINRGARRALISVEIERHADAPEPLDFASVGDTMTRDGLAQKVAAAGLWTSFRTRPYSKVPAVDSAPAAIYVTAMESEPLSPNAKLVIENAGGAFEAGLRAIPLLTDGKVYVCTSPDFDMGSTVDRVEIAQFSGPHPAGLAGTHMHFLEPPTAERMVWTIGYQDVIAIGRLLETGKINPERIVALSGPMVREPRLIRTLQGASLYTLTDGEIEGDDQTRIISGSILSGRAGYGPSAYLGRYDRQITVIEEDRSQAPLGWIRPMPHKYAVQPVLGSAFSKKLHALTSNLNGGRRAMVPLGTFEGLMPQDFLPTQLLRALLVMDTDQAQALGALELDEEDLGLCGFACPAKYEYAQALRDCLTKIEKEG
ncbi:MAG: Na(+)-translocating NADH-quinone reductase subunit A [Marinovum sp.]|nr:Na(+)-translocating NADH-quinone reductase subunit A [Marinovum sp.]